MATPTSIKRSLMRTEARLALMFAWTLVFVVPLRHAIRVVGKPAPSADASSTGHPRQRDAIVLKRAQSVTARLARVADGLPWHSTCFVRAIAGSLLLRRRGIDGAIIRLGLRNSGQDLNAHAWLILDGHSLLGGEEAEGFTPLADLGSTR